MTNRLEISSKLVISILDNYNKFLGYNIRVAGVNQGEFSKGLLTLLEIKSRLWEYRSSIINSGGVIILTAFGRGKQGKLYRQWVKYADLPSKPTRRAAEPESVTDKKIDPKAFADKVHEPQIESVESGSVCIPNSITSEEITTLKSKRQSRLLMLYILLAVSVILTSGAIALLIIWFL